MLSPHPFTARDGLVLTRRSWPLENPRGTVLLVHGISEHSGRYDPVAAHMQARGWAVESYDQRGHGLSQGPRGGLNRDEDLLADLGGMVRALHAEQPDGPIVLMGHSMGGLVVGRYMAGFTERRRPAWLAEVDGAVMVSPALRIRGGMPPFLLKVGRAVLPGLPLSTRNWFDPGDICHDKAVVQAYLDDDLVHFRITPRLACFIAQAGEQTLNRAPYWNRPSLLLYASADRIVDPRGSAEFARRAPRGLLRAQAFPAHAHELLNESHNADVLAPLDAWLDEMAGGRLSSTPALRWA